jgi:hypothetical protein
MERDGEVDPKKTAARRSSGQLVPSVTEKDWETLRDIERRSAETEEHLREVRKKYGLGETG